MSDLAIFLIGALCGAAVCFIAWWLALVLYLGGGKRT